MTREHLLAAGRATIGDSEKGSPRQDKAARLTRGLRPGVSTSAGQSLGAHLEEVFDPSSFGYLKGRKTADALAKVWHEVQAGNEWIVDADLKLPTAEC